MEEFKNKKILITGGAKGLGFAFVESFAQLCSEVIFIDKEKAEGKKIEKYFRNKKKKVFFYYSDLSKFQESIKIFKKILKKHRNIDFLINNARSGQRYEILKETERNWIRSIDVILKNSFFFSQEFIKQNIYKKTPRCILNISSIITKTISKQSE